MAPEPAPLPLRRASRPKRAMTTEPKKIAPAEQIKAWAIPALQSLKYGLRLSSDLCLSPKEGWLSIKEQEESVASLYRRYVLVLAALDPLATLIGVLVSNQLLEVGLVSILLRYLGLLAIPFVGGVIIEKLAPFFNASVQRSTAVRLVAYSLSPTYLLGITAIAPGLTVINIFGAYGLYLFYVGFKTLITAPKERMVGYLSSSLILMLLTWAIIAQATIAPLTRSTPRSGPFDPDRGSISGRS